MNVITVLLFFLLLHVSQISLAHFVTVLREKVTYRLNN